MSKEDFVKVLCSMSREQITKFIKEKGTEPKLYKPFIILSKK